MDRAADLARLTRLSGAQRTVDCDDSAGLSVRTDSPRAAGRHFVQQHLALSHRRNADAADMGRGHIRAPVFAPWTGSVDHRACVDGHRAVRAGSSRNVANALKEKSKMAEMGVYETMRTLRAVRRLRPDPIPDDVLHRALEAATWAPTGGNVQPWRIVVVKDRALKEPLGKLYNERWVAY